jgi:hypothetical protein
VNRRRLLTGLVATAPLLAGCNVLSGPGETDQTNNTTATTAGTNTTERSPTETDAAATDATKTDSTETDSGKSTPSTTAPYASMIPVPDDPSDFDFDFYQLDALRERQRESADFRPGSADEDATYPGIGGFEIPFAEIDTLLVAEWDVVIGPFAKEPIITTLRQQSDADLRETYKGYEIYVESDDASANAISGETLISGLFPEPSLSGIKATIDVMVGDGERFYDANEDFRALVDALGIGLVVTGKLNPDIDTENVQNDVGFGFTVTAEDTMPVFSIVVLFEDPATADTEGVRELFVEDPEFRTYFTDPKDVTVEQTGRVVTLSGEYNPEQTSTAATTTASSTTATPGDEFVLSPLVTYMNSDYGYRIDRPEGWNVDESLPERVEIANLDGDGIRISVFEGQYASVTLEEVVDESLANTRQSATTLDVAERREMTLDSGQPAIVLDVTYDVPTDTAGSLRSYLLLAKQGPTVYQVEFVADAPDWTSTVESEARDIIESFAVTTAPTTTTGTIALVRGW